MVSSRVIEEKGAFSEAVTYLRVWVEKEHDPPGPAGSSEWLEYQVVNKKEGRERRGRLEAVGSQSMCPGL